MKKDFISIKDLNKTDLETLFSLAERLKKLRLKHKRLLDNKVFALIFEKPSLRTRVTFETGIYELGGNSIYLSQKDIGIGSRETVKDIAQNLSKWISGIIARVFTHQTLVDLAIYASIPVINALSDLEHPCQALADLFTIKEKFNKFDGLKFAYIGDGNNVCHSLMLGAKIVGLNMWVASPKGYEPMNDYIKLSSAKIVNDPIEAVNNANVVYTDVWVSMGQEEERKQRLKVFKNFQVNFKLLKHAKPNCLIMHCLPAHRGEEITSEVIDSQNSIVIDQAANRLHIQKALLIKLFAPSNIKSKQLTI
ncbi:MAG: ornithine carbamoyltransferase [bacterium]|nr:ornithine carbamoyltransferase [bacterium]